MRFGRLGVSSYGLARRGQVSHGAAGMAWRVTARFGEARQAWRSKAGFGRAGRGRLGLVWTARLGWARRGRFRGTVSYLFAGCETVFMAVQYREHFGFGGPYLPYDVDENGEDLVQWCGEESKWKCACPRWTRDSRCIHVYWAQGQEDVPVSGRYL